MAVIDLPSVTYAPRCMHRETCITGTGQGSGADASWCPRCRQPLPLGLTPCDTSLIVPDDSATPHGDRALVRSNARTPRPDSPNLHQWVPTGASRRRCGCQCCSGDVAGRLLGAAPACGGCDDERVETGARPAVDRRRADRNKCARRTECPTPCRHPHWDPWPPHRALSAIATSCISRTYV